MGILAGVGSPQAFSTANGGKIYSYNNITTVPATVAPANPSRTNIRFHNPGSVDLFIAPALAYATVTANSPSALTPTTVNLGGTFRVFANGGTLDIGGECQGAWQALAASGTTNNLTVMDSNI